MSLFALELILITPYIQKYIKGKFGNQVFRLLGFNTSFGQAAKAALSQNRFALIAVGSGFTIVLADDAVSPIINHRRYLRLISLAEEAKNAQMAAFIRSGGSLVICRASSLQRWHS